MKRIALATLPFLSSTAYAAEAADKTFSFFRLIDTPITEFQSAIEIVVVAIFGFISFVHGVFG